MRFLSPVRYPALDLVSDAWTRFVETGRCDPQAVRPYVLRAWQRSRAARCDPRLPRADILGPEDTRALLDQQQRLIGVASPFLAALSRAAGGERHAAMLADPAGRLLRVVGDAETVADENFPRPGSLLSETMAGANGVGTALAEDGYVELVGPEHFIQGFHVFTCQGVPLQGSNSEQAGVLSVSVRRQETADRVRDILFCASEAAQCELLASWIADAAGVGGAPPVLERLRQDMIQRITTARLQLELAARQIATGSDATTTMDAALELSRKFRRQSAVWRELATQEINVARAEPIELADVAEDFAALMQTEARIAGVQLRWGRGDRVAVVDDLRLLTRRLLSAILSALQVATPGATVRLHVVAEARHGRILITEDQADGVNRRGVVESPLLR